MDAVLDHTGPWHYSILLLNAFGGFHYAWHIMAYQFMAPKDLEYWCARPNDSLSVDEWRDLNSGVDLHCFVKTADGGSSECNSWEYDRSVHQRTLTEEWNAVCGREYLTDSSQSLMMAGMVGELMFSQMADWYGRRRMLIISYVINILTGFAVAATSTFWTFSITRMLNLAVSMTFLTLALECVGPDKRALVSISGCFAWFFGLITLPLITYNVRDWRMLQIINTLPAIVWLIWSIYVDESPKWLASTCRFERAAKLLKKIVDRNKLQNVDVDAVIAQTRNAIEKERKTQSHGTITDLFRGLVITRTTFIFVLNHTTGVFIYYYLLYYTVELGSNPYANVIITAFTEAPFSIVSYFVIRFCRRKPVYFVTYSLVVAPLVVLLFVPKTATALSMILALGAKLSGQVTWSVVQVQVNELYPTYVRALASSFVHTTSRIGAIIAPLLSSLNGTKYSWVPVVLTISLCVASWLASLLLPETLGRPLPDTLQESLVLLNGNEEVSKKETTTERTHRSAGPAMSLETKREP